MTDLVDNPLADLIRLEDICDEYLGLSFDVARRKHALGKLGLKAFRLNNSRRGPLFVHPDDLQSWITRRRNRGSPLST